MLYFNYINMTDLQKTRLKIIAAPFIVVIFFFAVWLIAGKNQEGGPMGSAPSGEISKVTGPERISFGNAFKKPSSEAWLPVATPENNLPGATTTFLSRITQATTEVRNKIAAESAKPGAQPLTTDEVATQREIVLNITDEEFRSLYPDNFLKALAEGAQQFIKEQDPSYAPVAALKNDSDVRYVQEKLALALVAARMIDEERARQFIFSIRFTLPQLQLEVLAQRHAELEFKNLSARERMLKNGLSVASRLPDFITTLYGGELRPVSREIKMPKQFYAGEILGALTRALVKDARAVCGECHVRYPECYSEGPDFYGRGPIRAAIACECSGCFYGLGCIDGCSPFASIFDDGTNNMGPPPTFICGCGGPSSPVSAGGGVM